MKFADKPCFDCGRGTLRARVVTKSFSVLGQRIRVPGVALLECDTCGERNWPASEIERAREIARVKSKLAA